MIDEEHNEESHRRLQAQLLIALARVDLLETVVVQLHKDSRIGDSRSSVSVDEWIRGNLKMKIERYLASLSDHDPLLATELWQILEDSRPPG